jgi:RNA polymerase sigma factor (sigma-70 family)
MNLKKFSDQELVSAYISGKEICLSHLVERHQARVFGYILMTIRDREISEDIFQDTFVKVITKIKEGSYKEEGKFIQWVLRIAHNLMIDHFRRESKVTVLRGNDEYDIFDTIQLYDENYEDGLIKTQTDEKIRQLVEKLPETQKEVLFMRHYADMSFKDIAETTGVSINTALGRMRYALINLRKLMEEHNVSFAQ